MDLHKTIYFLSCFFGHFFLCAAMLAAPGASAAVIFKDDFESGALNKVSGAAHWDGAAYVAVSADRAVSGSHSAKFNFAGSPALEDDAFSELRFDVGALYSSLWVQFRLFIPANYKHRSGAGAANNKLFRLWGIDYGDDEKVGYSLWPNGVMSSVYTDWSFNAEGVGPKGEGYANLVTTSDLGKWVTIKIYIKAATAALPGTMKLWKNGLLIVDDTQQIDNFRAGNAHAYRYGYLLGASNSGFSETTNLYIDDVIFATGEADLNGGQTEVPAESPPAAPVLHVTQVKN